MRFTDSTVDYCNDFATFPERGMRRDDLRPGLRTVGFRRQGTVAFAVLSGRVYIIGIYYGGQDYETALRFDEQH